MFHPSGHADYYLLVKVAPNLTQYAAFEIILGTFGTFTTPNAFLYHSLTDFFVLH